MILEVRGRERDRVQEDTRRYSRFGMAWICFESTMMSHVSSCLIMSHHVSSCLISVILRFSVLLRLHQEETDMAKESQAL